MTAKGKRIVGLSKRFSTIAETLFENKIAEELRFASMDRRSVAEGTRTDKKNYAELLSRAVAQRFADALRDFFIGLLPNPDGSGQESKARTLSYPLIFLKAKMQLTIGVSARRLSYDES